MVPDESDRPEDDVGWLIDSPSPGQRDDRLDQLRIQRISKLRRSAIRVRTWWAAGAGVCFLLAGVAVNDFVHWPSHRFDLLLTPLLIGVAAFCVKCAMEPIPDARPTGERFPIDFTQLGNDEDLPSRLDHID